MKKAIINTIIIILVACLCIATYYAGHQDGYTDAQLDMHIKFYEETF